MKVLMVCLGNICRSPSPPAAAPGAEKFLTRKETAARLNITLATLHQYTLSGKIAANRIGNRVLYKESDIQNALRQVKTQSCK